MSDLLNNIIDGNYDLVIADILRLNRDSGEDAASAKVLQVSMEAAQTGMQLMMSGKADKASKLMANFTLAMGKVDRALKDARLGILPESIQQDELLKKFEKDFEED